MVIQDHISYAGQCARERWQQQDRLSRCEELLDTPLRRKAAVNSVAPMSLIITPPSLVAAAPSLTVAIPSLTIAIPFVADSPASSLAVTDPDPTQRERCSACNQLGHCHSTSKKCVLRLQVTPADLTLSSPPTATNPAPRCGSCNQLGHRRRSSKKCSMYQ